MKITEEELKLFALLLGAPEPESLVVLEVMADEHPWLAAPLAELKHLPLDQWQGEHIRLFVSGFPTTVAPPFISAILHGHMGGSEEGELIDFYHRVGLQRNDMPADYLGTLFECAAWLMVQGSDNRDDFTQLWEGYIAPMLPEFADRLVDQADLQLYRQMGRRLKELTDENARLDT